MFFFVFFGVYICFFSSSCLSKSAVKHLRQIQPRFRFDFSSNTERNLANTMFIQVSNSICYCYQSVLLVRLLLLLLLLLLLFLLLFLSN